jgi:hypothetical protein
MRVFLWLVTAVALVAPPVGAASVPDFLNAVDKAIASDEAKTAIELICDRDDQDLHDYAKEHSKELLDAMGRWRVFMHRRYAEAFQPPDAVDSFFPPDAPWSEWSFLGAFGSVVGTKKGEIWADGRMVFSDSLNAVTVDLDLDGRPELTCQGGQPQFAPGLSVVHEDPPGDSRQQWLAAGKGVDPSVGATIWLYRDGPLFMAIIKPPEGGPCGRGWCLGKGL